MYLTSYVVLYSLNGFQRMTTHAELHSALDYCKNRYHFMRQENMLDDKIIVKEDIIGWDNGYGNENDRIRGNENYLEMANQVLEDDGCYIAWAVTSPFSNGTQMRDSSCTILKMTVALDVSF